MLDLGISKMALIGAVALIVIGPEKLPRVARTVGTLLGKAQRYVADVKAEVNRAMDLDELKKMKESVEEAGREVEKGIYSTKADFEKDWSSVTAGLDGSAATSSAPNSIDFCSAARSAIEYGARASMAGTRSSANCRVCRVALWRWKVRSVRVAGHFRTGS